MAINKGYLTSDNTEKGDEVYTPYYAVEPIIKYLEHDFKIWCPFDQEWSAFYNMLNENGFNVVRTSSDFFNTQTPKGVDIIVSNPPYSKKDKVLEECINRDIPFVLLLPVQTLQGKSRYNKIFSKLKTFQLLNFDKRIGFHTCNDYENFKLGNHFASSYFIGNIDLLPRDIVFEELEIYNRPLKKGCIK